MAQFNEATYTKNSIEIEAADGSGAYTIEALDAEGLTEPMGDYFEIFRLAGNGERIIPEASNEALELVLDQTEGQMWESVYFRSEPRNTVWGHLGHAVQVGTPYWKFVERLTRMLDNDVVELLTYEAHPDKSSAIILGHLILKEDIERECGGKLSEEWLRAEREFFETECEQIVSWLYNINCYKLTSPDVDDVTFIYGDKALCEHIDFLKAEGSIGDSEDTEEIMHMAWELGF